MDATLALSLFIGLSSVEDARPAKELPPSETCRARWMYLEKESYRVRQSKELLPEYRHDEIDVVADNLWFASWIWWVAEKVQRGVYDRETWVDGILRLPHIEDYSGFERRAMDWITKGYPLP